MKLRALLPLLLALPALAQERAVMGGFQVGLMKPLSSGQSYASTDSLVDGKIGFNLGGHVSFNLQNGHMLRVRLEDSATKGHPTGGGYDNTVVTASLMGDYLYHLDASNTGFYLTAGVGFETTYLKRDGAYGSTTDHTNGFAWDAGLGWQFTPHVGLETRYASTHPTYFGTAFKNDRAVLAVAFSF